MRDAVRRPPPESRFPDAESRGPLESKKCGAYSPLESKKVISSKKSKNQSKSTSKAGIPQVLLEKMINRIFPGFLVRLFPPLGAVDLPAAVLADEMPPKTCPLLEAFPSRLGQAGKNFRKNTGVSLITRGRE